MPTSSPLCSKMFLEDALLMKHLFPESLFVFFAAIKLIVAEVKCFVAKCVMHYTIYKLNNRFSIYHLRMCNRKHDLSQNTQIRYIICFADKNLIFFIRKVL